MAPFLSRTPGYLQDPSSTTECAYCIYSKGSEYLQSLNLKQHYYGESFEVLWALETSSLTHFARTGWRDIGITALFCLSSYGFVFLLMKLRTKKTKAAAKVSLPSLTCPARRRPRKLTVRSRPQKNK